MGMMYSVHSPFNEKPMIDVTVIEKEKGADEFRNTPFMVTVGTNFIWMSYDVALELVNKLNYAMMEHDLRKVGYGKN